MNVEPNAPVVTLQHSEQTRVTRTAEAAIPHNMKQSDPIALHSLRLYTCFAMTGLFVGVSQPPDASSITAPHAGRFHSHEGAERLLHQIGWQSSRYADLTSGFQEENNY